MESCGNIEKNYIFEEHNWWNNASLENDIKTTMIACYANPLYYTSQDKKHPGVVGLHTAEQREAFSDYLNVLLPYLKNTEFLESWNEPNLLGFWGPTTEVSDYFRVLENTQIAAKKYDETLNVAGFATSGLDTNYIKNGFDLGAYPFCEYVTYHPYCYPAQPDVNNSMSNNIAKVNEIILNYGGWKESVITEVGWPVVQDSVVTEQLQAESIIKQYVFGDEGRVKYTYIYDIKNDGVNPLESEDNYGIMEIDNTPRKAYIAVCEMNRIIGGAIYHGKIDLGLGDNCYAFVYSKDKKPIIIAWMSEGNAQYKFEENIQVKDMYGNPVETGSSVKLGLAPVYISNISDNWFKKAGFRNVDMLQEKFSRAYLNNMDKELKDKILSCFDKNLNVYNDELFNEIKISEAINNLFEVGNSIISYAENGKYTLLETSKMLYELFIIADTLANSLAVTVNEMGTISSDDAVSQALTNSKNSYKTAEIVKMYSDEILRYAREYNEDLNLVLEEDENPAKAGIVKAWDILSEGLCLWYNKIEVLEDPQNLSFSLILPLNERSAVIEKNTVYNLIVENRSESDINGVIEAYDGENNLIGTSDLFELSVDEEKSVTVNADFGDKRSDNVNMLYFVLKGNDKVIRKINVDLANVTEAIDVEIVPATSGIDKLQSVNLKIKNKTTSTKNLKASLNCSNISFSNTTIPVSLNGYEEKTVSFPIKSIEPTEYNMYMIDIKLHNSFSDIVYQNVLPLSFLMIEKADVEIDIENSGGSAEMFKDAYPFYLNPPAMPEVKENWYNSLTAARAMAKWDDAYLYMLIDVYDNMFTQKYFGEYMWQGDCIQLTLDMLNDKTQYYQSDDIELGAALSPNGINTYAWAPAEFVGIKSKNWVNVWRNNEKSLTRYMLKIPSSELALIEFADGSEVGLNLAVNDADGAVRTGAIEFTQGIVYSKEPKLWKSFVMGDSSTPEKLTVQHVFEDEIIDFGSTVENEIFVDMVDNWAKDHVLELYGKGYVEGVSAKEFAPERFVTRAEFLKMIMLSSDIKTGTYKQLLDDCNTGAWYDRIVNTAYNLGILDGIVENNLFKPETAITRGEMSRIAYNIYKYKNNYVRKYEQVISGFNDYCEIAFDDVVAINLLCANKVLSGFEDNTIRPNSALTRAESAKIINLFSKIISN